MTLQANELVYQSDYMSVPPTADTAIYSLLGDQIITGLVATTSTSGVTLTAGKAILQGRLFELKQTTTYDWPSGVTSAWIGLMGRLSNTNILNPDGTVTNNQYTFGIFTTPDGDLNRGNTIANIPIWRVSKTTVTTTLVPNMSNGFTSPSVQTPVLASGFEVYDSTQPVGYRAINGALYIKGAVKRTSQITSADELTVFTLPGYYRPATKQNYIVQGSIGGRLLVTVNTNGAVTVSRYTFNGTDFTDFTTSTWINLGGSILLG